MKRANHCEKASEWGDQIIETQARSNETEGDLPMRGDGRHLLWKGDIDRWQVPIRAE